MSQKFAGKNAVSWAMETVPHDIAHLFIELGLVVVLLAVLARVANRLGISAISFYLLSGLAMGKGGLAPLNLTTDSIHLGAEIGVLLLLFMLGLEYSGEQLKENLQSGLPAGIVDLLLNFPPGLIAGLLMGWKPLPAVLLGGVTYISSSGVIAKVLEELKRLDSPETPIVLSILVIEDLAMAVYLPLVAVLLIGGGPLKIAISVSVAVVTVFIVLLVAIRFGSGLSAFFAHSSDEITLLTITGAVLLVAGIAQQLKVSAAIGAFLVGIAVSGQMAEQSHRLLAPFRDLLAAIFFFFFGLEVDPASLPPAFLAAGLLAAVTTGTKALGGYWAVRRTGMDRDARWRAGMALVARGEFSIVIAGLGLALEPRIGPFSAAYVLILAVVGPVLTRFAR